MTKNKIIRDYLLDNLKQFSSAFSDVNVETVISFNFIRACESEISMNKIIY